MLHSRTVCGSLCGFVFVFIRKYKYKTTMKCRLTHIRMAIIKKTRNNKCWRGCREKGPLYTAGRYVNWCSHYETQCRGSLKN